MVTSIAPPPKCSAGNWQTPCPPPPPPCNSPPKCLQQIFCYQFVAALQFPVVYPAPSNTVAATNALPLNISVTKHSPPQMPAADVLRPVCCCPPISCGAPCTLYPAAQLQLPTPAPLMVVPPPPIFCCQFLALKWQTPCPPPPPHPCSRLYAIFAFSDHKPPKYLQQIFCCQFVAALQFLVVYLAPRSTVAACPPLPPSWRSPPPHPPPQIFGCKPPKEHPADFLLPVPCCSGPPMFPPKRQAAQSLSPFW